MVISNVPATTKIDSSAVAWTPPALVTRTVKSRVPVEVGVPAIVPAADSDRPDGSAPAVTAHVYGAAPPVASRSAV